MNREVNWRPRKQLNSCICIFAVEKVSLTKTTNSGIGRHMVDYSPQDVESRSFCSPLTKYHVDRRMHFRSFRASRRIRCVAASKFHFVCVCVVRKIFSERIKMQRRATFKYQICRFSTNFSKVSEEKSV